jgi:hypothetical protein
MQKRIWKYVMMGVLLTTGSSVWAQSHAEQQVKAYLDQLQYWRFQYSPEDSGVDPNASAADSVLYANRMLVNYLKDNHSMLRGNFKIEGENEITVAASDDRRMRIYSWDTETGDEMHIYNAVMQYDAGGGTKAKVLKDISLHKDNKEDPGVLYPEIFTLGDGKKYYLVVYSSIISSKDAKKGVRAYTVENSEIADANIFQLPNGTTNKIEYTYDYYSNYDYKKMKENQVIHMEKGKLYVPLAEGDKITGKWNVYRFDGGKLVLEK